MATGSRLEVAADVISGQDIEGVDLHSMQNLVVMAQTIFELFR